MDNNETYKKMYFTSPALQELIDLQNNIQKQFYDNGIQQYAMEVQNMVQINNFQINTEVMKLRETVSRTIQESFKFEEMTKVVNNTTSYIGNIALQIQNAVNNMMPNFTKLYSDLYHAPIFQRQRLGELNWVLPMQIKNLTELENSETLDEDIKSIYYSNNSALLSEMIQAITESMHTNKRMHIVEEVIMAYDMGLYNIAGTSLSTMVEWFLVDEDNKVNIKLYQLYEKFARKFDEVVITEPCVHILFALNKFIENYTQSIKFDKEEPTLLNRHWIMHGRMTQPFTQYHCLQLISVLYAIVELLEVEIEDEERC